MAQNPAAAGPGHPATDGAGRRALVVEDEVPLATLLASYLERAGFEVTVTHDGT